MVANMSLQILNIAEKLLLSGTHLLYLYTISTEINDLIFLSILDSMWIEVSFFLDALVMNFGKNMYGSDWNMCYDLDSCLQMLIG